jgi:DNA polymerase-3 subunit gamma/tau
MSDKVEDVTKEEYRVLARKYRPSNFRDLIGQEPMVKTLSNAFDSGRIAQAYMLTGVRGVGKTTTARILARALNYKSDLIDKPNIDLDDLGENCEAIMAGSHVDVIEMDAASHTGIGDIREIIASVQYKPVSARYKVYIIDEVHMLSTAAFNGLLKTLEEPPEHVKFIFATTEIRKVPITVLSRCQRFDLRRIEAEELCSHLQKIAHQEKVEVEEDALAMIARAAEGSVRDALSLFDQAIAHSESKVLGEDVRIMLGLSDRGRVIDLFEHVMAGKTREAMDELKSQYDVGAEPVTVLNDLADFVHYVTKVRFVPEVAENSALSQAERERGKDLAEKLSLRILGRIWQMLLKGIGEVQASSRPLAAADMLLVRLTHVADLPTPDEVIKQIQSGQLSNDGNLPTGGTTNGGSNIGGGAAGTGSGGGSAVGATSGITANGGSNNDSNAPTALHVVEGNRLARPNITPQDEPQQSVALKTFQELIDYCEVQREIKLKLYLRNHIRLVNFEQGKIEFNLIGNVPRDFYKILNEKLLEWTGQRWLLTTTNEESAFSLAEKDEAQKEAMVEDATNDPTIQAVLNQFPQAKIIDVRMREMIEALPAVPEVDAEDMIDSDESSLDDFFEE